MKRFLLVLGVGVALALVVFFLGLLRNALDHQNLVGHVRQPELETVNPGWPGNAIDHEGRFMDENNPFLPNTTDLLRWRFSRNPFAEEKRTDPWRPQVKDPAEFLSSGADGILWLGHASFLIRFGSTVILTDPVFGDPAILRRLMTIASPLEKISDVDFILLSHDHRDHMDESTLRALAERFPEAVFLAGLRSEDVLRDWITPTNTIRTAGWFQKFDLRDTEVEIFFHPVRHWSQRWILDTNWRLWGSFVIRHGPTTIYFGGDSGFASHYAVAGDLFDEIDYFLIGIGAYEPRWFMRPNHNNPADAMTAFLDAGARVLVPMHYGTFDLSDEPPSQPLRLLHDEAERVGVTDRVRVLGINEAIVIE